MSKEHKELNELENHVVIGENKITGERVVEVWKDDEITLLSDYIAAHYTPNEEVAKLKSQLSFYKLNATEACDKLTEIKNAFDTLFSLKEK